MRITDDTKLPDELISNYFSSLINQLFKILPLKENGEPSLPSYMLSLQRELIGCKSLLSGTNYDANIARLIFTLQFMIDNDCSVATTKTEIFKSISLCKKIKTQYFETQKGV